MKTNLSAVKKCISGKMNFLILIALSAIFVSSSFDDGVRPQKNISPEWNQFHSVSMKDSLTQGVPVNFGPGITLTVDEIMQKEAMFPKDYYPKVKPKSNPDIEEDEYPEVPPNPNSPDVSQWPPRNPDQKSTQPQQTDNPQTIGTSFLGPQLSEAGYIPPDSQGDVGPSQVLVCANGRIKVYSKAGVLGGLNADLDVFFSSVDNGTGTSDPHIRYDRLTQRWYIVGINLPASGANRIMIARSSGPTITNTASFTFFQFQQDAAGTPGADLGAFADYPTLGVDKFALYIGCNMFNPSYIGTSVWVINKTNLNAGSLTVTGFHQISNSGTEGPRTPQGVDNDDPSATEGYFIGVSNFSYSRLTIRRVTNPGTSPALSGNLSITVPTTGPVISVPCLGTTGSLDGIDDRLYAADIHKNKITGAITLWTAHHTQVNTSGVYSASGGRLGSRWYEVANLTTTPVLNQSGTLFDNAASNPRSYWMPSCVMSGQGHMAIGSSTGGTGKRAEIYVAGRFRSDALGSTQTAILAQSSSTAYNVEGGGVQRWGDYSQTVVDPNDDMTIWTFQEYCNANNSWGVRAIQLKAPLPALPSASSLTNINTGQPSVNIVITGTSSGGTEFFDPGADAGGPGFANRIAASITGGVIVNSVTFNSPTQVTLNISTVSATTGLKNITITNPDGQTSTGNNLINIQNPPVLTLTAYMQGFYNASTNLLVRDTARVYLRNSSSPYGIVDSGKVYLSTSGSGTISFNNAVNGTVYYLQLKHRNSMETWSKSPGQSFVSSALSYDFTSAAAQAFGSNMLQVDASPVEFAIYGGDINADGIVDVSDVSPVDNASLTALSGYVITDLTGDNFVDVDDVSIVDNNSFSSVGLIRP